MKVIARIKTDFTTKFGIPRQSGIIDELKGKIIFEPEFRNPEAFRGLEDFSHIWVIWKFSENSEIWNPTVRPPKLGGNVRMGVFATRSPFRPNPIGMSSLKLDSIEFSEKFGLVLNVAGVDMKNDTPIYDIKPYIPYTDCHSDALSGFSKSGCDDLLNVDFPPQYLAMIPKEKRSALIKVLELDPRPQYQDDPERVYGFGFAEFEIKFNVCSKSLYVISVDSEK